MDWKSFCSTVLSCFPCCQNSRGVEELSQAGKGEGVAAELVFAKPEQVLSGTKHTRICHTHNTCFLPVSA